MNGLFPRGIAALLACTLFAASATAETSLEIIAGGAPFVNASANSVPVSPKALALGPDGNLYLADDASGKILRFDPATSRVTSVPNLPGMLEYRFSAPQALSYGPGSVLNLLAGQDVWLLDLVDGFQTYPGYTQYTYNSFTFAPDGSMYFTRINEHAVIRRAPFGGLTNVAGLSSTPGFSGDGTATARFNNPRGVVVDAAGNVYIADSGNHRVRRRAAGTGTFTTIAGNSGTVYNGDNLPATLATLSTPTLLAIDGAGNLFVYDDGHHRIRKINAATGFITTVAGNGTLGGASGNGGLATSASLNTVADIKVASDGTLYIAEPDSYRVRKVDASGIINDVIGNGMRSFCGENVPARDACLNRPNGITLDAARNIYFSDQNNRRVRKISAATGIITTVAGGNGVLLGDGGPAVNAYLPNGPAGITVDPAGNLYFAAGGRVRRVDGASGIITTFVGAGGTGFAGDGGPAYSAKLNGVSRVALDAAGNLYLTDIYNNRVRRVDATTGIIRTVAGNGSPDGPLGDGGPALNASLAWPHNLAFDPEGNLLIGDTNHFRIRKLNVATGIITTVAGNGNNAIDGNGGLATNAGIGNWPAFDVDAGGNIYVTASSELRRIDAATGIIDKAPAPVWGLYTPEGRGLENPNDMVLGPDGKLYITDAATNNLVLRVSGLPNPAGDQTPPVITPNYSGTPGNNGWYRSDVHLTWTVTDPESPVTWTGGCEESDVQLDTEGVSFVCVATSAGGTAQKLVVIKRDTHAPELTFGERSPAPDATGWSSGDVSVPFSVTDDFSGVYSTSSPSPVVIGGTGSNLTESVVVTDRAGNSSTFITPVVNIDRSAPVVTASVLGTLGENGWYTSDVMVYWNATEDEAAITATSGCDTGSVMGDTTGVTFTCTVTSAGGSTTQSVTIMRDATAPVLEFGAPTPAANAAGWNSGDVSFPFIASDETSGVATTSTSNPAVVVGVGANLSADVVVTDIAGNTATFSTPAVNIDRAAPSVVADISGTPGTNGWYTSDVHVNWTTTGAYAPIDSSDGCGASSIVTDTAGITFTCTATSAGGTTTQTATIKRDATPPQLVFGAPSPAANSAGWYGGDVRFAFDTSDSLSGIASTSINSPVVVTGDGANRSASVVVTDGAGNTATFETIPVSIDRSPPTVQASIAGTIGNNGWYTSDVRVSWAIDESPASLLSSNGCDESNVLADTAGAIFTCSVASGGGTASSSVTVKRDATPPELTFGTPSPAANVNGWNKTNVSIPFTRSDALSGLASTSTTSPVVLGIEGPGITGQVTVSDLAGNSSTFNTVPRNIDKAAPVVTITTPGNGASYGFYQDVIGDFSCTDLSLVSCVGSTANGEPVNTKTAGARTFKVTGKDLALFTTAVTNTFTVDPLFNFEGFLAPANEPPTLNLVSRGSLVPIRWRLPDGHGGFVSNTASFTSATVGSLACGSDTAVPLNDTATGPAGISFDASSSTFTYHWQTSASWTGCRKLTIKLKDASLHELRFKFQ